MAMAQTVCVAGKEGGAQCDPGLTETILSGCLDVLFNQGFIATDSKPLRVEGEAWEALDGELLAAREGFSDYLLSFFVVYGLAGGNPSQPFPLSFSYRILSVSDGQLLGEGELAVPEYKPENFKNMEKLLSGLGSSVAEAFLDQRGRKK